MHGEYSMSTTLTNGLKLPDKGSVDWYADMQNNYTILDNSVGTIAEHSTQIAGKAPLVHTHGKADITDLFNSANEWTEINTYTTALRFSAANYSAGTPSSNIFYGSLQWGGIVNNSFVQSFGINSAIRTTGINDISLRVWSQTGSIFRGVAVETNADASNSSFRPLLGNAIDLGSTAYQWNNAYIKSLTINGVACGDILPHNVSEFVKVTGDQIIDGTKTFRQEVTMFGRDINLMSRIHYGKNSNPSTNAWHYLYFRGNTAAEGYTDAWYSGYLEQFLSTNGSARGRWLVRDTSESTVALELFVRDNVKQVRPQENNTTDLGTSTNKWKSFNGINPGALSLPDIRSGVQIDITNWNNRASPSGEIGSFTAPVDCIVSIQMTRNVDWGVWVINGNFRQSFRSADNNGNHLLFLIFPVAKGESIAIYCPVISSDKTPITFVSNKQLYFPCLGNV